MRRAVLFAALLPLLAAACAAEPAGSPEAGAGPPQPTALRLTVTGETEPVLDLGTSGQVELLREGADEPVAVAFENGAVTVHDLPPGRYSIEKIGPLACRGLGFEVGSSSPGRALGSLDAEIIATDYYVALMSRRAATGPEVADLAARLGTAPDAIDARPVTAPPSALCHVGRNGESMSWDDLPLEEKIMVGAVIAGFCAIAVTAGGFCAF